jgi:hypothetical protein
MTVHIIYDTVQSMQLVHSCKLSKNEVNSSLMQIFLYMQKQMLTIICQKHKLLIYSHMYTVTIDGVWVDNQIYWTLTDL